VGDVGLASRLSASQKQKSRVPDAATSQNPNSSKN
jgi:hypothetical protein